MKKLILLAAVLLSTSLASARTVAEMDALTQNLASKFASEFSEIKIESVTFYLDDDLGSRVSALEAADSTAPIYSIKIIFRGDGMECTGEGLVKKGLFGGLTIGKNSGICL